MERSSRSRPSAGSGDISDNIMLNMIRSIERRESCPQSPLENSMENIIE